MSRPDRAVNGWGRDIRGCAPVYHRAGFQPKQTSPDVESDALSREPVERPKSDAPSLSKGAEVLAGIKKLL